MAAFRSLCGRGFAFSRRVYATQLQKRNFLSEAYKCEKAWAERLASPLLSKVNPTTLYGDIDHSFLHYGRASPVDIDIYANTLTDQQMVWELEDVLFKLRLSPDTHRMLPSTPHAVIRFLLQHRETDTLLRILRLRTAYGMFPDKFCSNMMMDTFLKEKNYRAAARVAVEEMLQENYNEPLTLQLALYSCHMYLRNPEEWYSTDELPEPEPEPEESVKIRVKYIRNPFFDDHFDIVDPKNLLGKTFSSFGAVLEGSIGEYYRLLGFTLSGKYKKALEISNSLQKAPREIVTLARNHIKELSGEGVTTDVQVLDQSLEKLEAEATDEDLVKELETMIKATSSKEEPNHIQELTQLYKTWEELRISTLKEAQRLEEEEQLRKSIDERKEELILEERELYFFQNEEKLKLMIEDRSKLKKQLEEMKDNFLPISHVHTHMADKMPKDLPHRKLKSKTEQ